MNPKIRAMLPSDERFIHSSWHTSFWKTGAGRKVDKKLYNTWQDLRIQRLMQKCQVLVAYLEEVPDEILGWSCVGHRALHYVYVKGVYRRNGIASGLVLSDLAYYTHPTDTVGGLFMKKMNLEYNPYLELM